MADNERVISTVFKADISNFTASTQQLNRYVSQVNSEFRNATASMTRWNDNSEGLRAKLEQLNKVHDAEARKLKELQTQYADVVSRQGETSKEAQKLATAINNQSAVVKETKKNIDYYSDSLKELEDAGVNTREELDKLNKKLEDQKATAKDLGDKISKGVATGIAGIGAACVGAMAGLKSVVDETKELRTQMGMLETTFNEAGLGIAASKKTFNDLYAVLGDSGAATEASLHLAEFAKNEKELEELTNSLTGAYSKFGASLPLENIAEGVNTTLTLNQANAGMVDAIEFAGGSVEEFNEKLQALDTEEEKRAFILQTLNESYGEAGEKYKEVNKEVIAANEAQNKYNQAMAEVGEKAQPVITKLQTTMTEFLTNVIPPFTSSLSWIVDNLDILLPIVGSLTAGIVAQTAATKIKTITDLAAAQGISVMALAQKALNAAFKANPIGLVVTAIGLLVTAFVTLWNKCEGFRNFFINMWEGIKKIGSSVADFIGGIFESKINTAKGIINAVISLINGAIGAINKLKVDIPEWVPKYGGSTFGLNIPKIPALARGAVIDRPTLAMIGEAGKEVVMPLENNTQWIDKLADKLGANGGAMSKTINITNKFERMETSRHALHKANLETKRIINAH